jgi:hypothetical protein
MFIIKKKKTFPKIFFTLMRYIFFVMYNYYVRWVSSGKLDKVRFHFHLDAILKRQRKDIKFPHTFHPTERNL